MPIDISRLEPKVEDSAANSTPNKQNWSLPVAHGDSPSLPEQCEQPVTAGASASDSDSDSNSTQSSEPGVEPEDTEPEECQWGGGLGMATLDQGVNKLLQCKRRYQTGMGQGVFHPSL